MTIRRRWFVFRRQFLPGIAFTCLVVFTLFFWKAYLLPIEQPQGVRMASQTSVDPVAKAPAGKAVVSGSMGFINQ